MAAAAPASRIGRRDAASPPTFLLLHGTILPSQPDPDTAACTTAPLLRQHDIGRSESAWGKSKVSLRPDILRNTIVHHCPLLTNLTRSHDPGCHLVGSVPFASTEDVFRKCASGMQNRLRRIPDGETGNRNYFIQFQKSFFMAAPEMIPVFKMNSQLEMKDFTPEQVKEGIDKLKASPRETHYDDAAIESYKEFKKLLDQGVLPKGTKFQVSMPTHSNAILGFVQRDFQAEVEPIYKEALWQAMRNIQDAIPHEDLAFQSDIASDYIFLENISMFRPWFYNDDKDFDKRKEYIYDYIVKQIGVIDQDVEVGLHNCYGWSSTRASSAHYLLNR